VVIPDWSAVEAIAPACQVTRFTACSSGDFSTTSSSSVEMATATATAATVRSGGACPTSPTARPANGTTRCQPQMLFRGRAAARFGDSPSGFSVSGRRWIGGRCAKRSRRVGDHRSRTRLGRRHDGRSAAPQVRTATTLRRDAGSLEHRARRCSPAPSSLQHRSPRRRSYLLSRLLNDAVMPAKNMALAKNNVSLM